MSEMIERVARAMMEQDALGATADGPGIHRQGWRAYQGMARAAIEAMREPTDAMLCAASDWNSDICTADDRIEVPAAIEITWPAMIDAALKEDS